MPTQNPVDPLVVGLHIPKCAGLTVLRHVQRHLQTDLIFQCTAIFDNFDHDRPEFLSIRKKDRLKFVFGHHFHEEMLPLIRHPSFLFTGLREPLERMNSDLGYNERLYNYLGKTFDVKSYIDWVRNPTCNFLVQRFPRAAGPNGSLAERAMRVLECFHFVYFPETFSELCDKVTQTLGIPPVTKNENVTPSPKSFEVDPTNFTDDIALYKQAYEKWGPKSPVRGSEMSEKNLTELYRYESNLDNLRNFYYNITYLEYKNWNILDKVVDSRKSLLDEIQAELNFYQKLESHSDNPT